MKEKLKIEIPNHGREQFLASRKGLLDSFDKAKKVASSRPIQVSHGKTAEAEFRKWLNDFLPKKYAVTSGYVVSVGISDTEKLSHFDVIIYDNLNSPVLWIEGNPDESESGKARAIPVEYVKAVIEVKSVFNKKNVKDGIDQLLKLDKLMQGFDSTDERYKLYLPKDFFCGLVFLNY